MGVGRGKELTMPQATELVPRSAHAILDQTAETIAGLTDHQYRTPGSQGAAIGQHVRHALDHFRKLLDGYRHDGRVAYDRRDRGVPVEHDRAAALEEIASLAEGLQGLDETQLGFPIRVVAMVNGEGDEVEMESTLLRELWFATHHAIHHNALIKAVAAEFQAPLPQGFGRAPSTLNFERGPAR
jgi:uncharacterized damage-inducible protein DinB